MSLMHVRTANSWRTPKFKRLPANDRLDVAFWRCGRDSRVRRLSAGLENHTAGVQECVSSHMTENWVPDREMI